MVQKQLKQNSQEKRMNNQPVWKDALRTMVFNDNYIIYCYLNTARDKMIDEMNEIANMEKPIPRDMVETYQALKERTNYLDEEISKILEEQD
jgi:chromosome segregation ATPase